LSRSRNRQTVVHAVVHLQAEKAGERKPVADLILHRLVGQVVERLQDQDLEHQHLVERLAPGRGLAVFLAYLLEQRPEQLPWNLHRQPLQRIAHATDALQTTVDVEETGLWHGVLASMVSDSADFTRPLASQRIFQGAPK
jgi:hypothetical protein